MSKKTEAKKSAKKITKKSEAKKSAKKITKKSEAKKTIVELAQENSRNLNPYKDREKEIGQVEIPEFGNSKSGRMSRNVFLIALFFFNEIKKEDFVYFKNPLKGKIEKVPCLSGLFFANLFKSKGIDFPRLYKGHYPDSPLHQALHRISKAKTKEIRVTKSGKRIDTFAKGGQYLIFADKGTGLNNNRFYYPNLAYKKLYDEKMKGLKKSYIDTLIQECIEMYQ